MSKIPSFAGRCDAATGHGASNFPRPRVAQSIHVQHYPIPTGAFQTALLYRSTNDRARPLNGEIKCGVFRARWQNYSLRASSPIWSQASKIRSQCYQNWRDPSRMNEAHRLKKLTLVLYEMLMWGLGNVVRELTESPSVEINLTPRVQLRITASRERRYFWTGLEEMFISSNMRGDISLINVYCGAAMMEVCLWSKKSAIRWVLRPQTAFELTRSTRPPAVSLCCPITSYYKESDRGPRGGGDSHMKQTGMLVVSLRGVNFGFWSRLGCSGQSANILRCQGLV